MKPHDADKHSSYHTRVFYTRDFMSFHRSVDQYADTRIDQNKQI